MVRQDDKDPSVQHKINQIAMQCPLLISYFNVDFDGSNTILASFMC